MFCTQAPKQIWEEYRQAGSWVRLPQRVMEGACESKRGATDTRDAERHGFSALSPAARVWCPTLALRLPLLARKTRKKITPAGLEVIL